MKKKAKLNYKFLIKLSFLYKKKINFNHKENYGQFPGRIANHMKNKAWINLTSPYFNKNYLNHVSFTYKSTMITFHKKKKYIMITLYNKHYCNYTQYCNSYEKKAHVGVF